MDRPLRLIAGNPLDQLARTIEALLVIASAPLSVQDLADAADDHAERVETALGLVGERYQEGRSGIVLEHVAGGWAFRASRDAAEACARLFEKPAQRNLSQASLETLAIVAYLGPCSRPDIARIRGVSADSAVANLVERGLITESGRDDVAGAIRYRTTPLFERVFGLESLSQLPRLDDVGARHGADPRAPARGRRAAHRLDARGRSTCRPRRRAGDAVRRPRATKSSVKTSDVARNAAWWPSRSRPRISARTRTPAVMPAAHVTSRRATDGRCVEPRHERRSEPAAEQRQRVACECRRRRAVREHPDDREERRSRRRPRQSRGAGRPSSPRIRASG